MQSATLIYNDRVYAYKRMKELDALLDSEPTEDLVTEMAELGIRYRMGVNELDSMNKKGVLLHIHPLILHNTERDRLIKLHRQQPILFLEEYKNVSNNISRYQSYLKNKATADKKEKWQRQLDKHLATLELMKTIMQDNG